jgi:hypothetical protein
LPQFLTEISVKNKAPKDKPYKAFDIEGLYLEVYPNGSNKFVYMSISPTYSLIFKDYFSK